MYLWISCNQVTSVHVNEVIVGQKYKTWCLTLLCFDCCFRSWKRWTWNRKWASGSCTKFLSLFNFELQHVSWCQDTSPHPASQKAADAHTMSIHCQIKHWVDNVIDLELHCLCTAPLTKRKIACLGLYHALVTMVFPNNTTIFNRKLIVTVSSAAFSHEKSFYNTVR